MVVVQVLLIVVVVGVAVAVAAGWGDRMVSVPVDRAPTGLDPEDPVAAAEIPALRFNLALRGYRMAEVDEALARLATTLAAREDRIAELESGRVPTGRLGSVNADTATLPAPGPPDPVTPGRTFTDPAATSGR